MSRMPRAQVPIAGNLPPSREWLDYLRSLGEAGDASGIQKALQRLQEQVDGIDVSVRPPQLQAVGSVNAQGLLSDGLVQLSLIGDTAAPSSFNFYGADAEGVRGWFKPDISNLAGVDFTARTPVAGDALVFDGGHWSPGAVLSNPMIDVGDLIIGGSAGSPVRAPAGAIGSVLTSNGPSAAPAWKPPAAGSSGGRGYANARLKVAGSFIGLSDYGGTPSALTVGTNAQYFTPFSVEREIKIETLYAVVSALQATSVFRLGIYSNSDSGASSLPATLLGETGDLSGAVVGNVGGPLTPKVTLVPGVVYWAAFLTRGGNAGFRCHAVANFPPAWLGRQSATVNNAYNHYFAIGAWVSLPAAFSSGTITSANIPAIYLTE